MLLFVTTKVLIFVVVFVFSVYSPVETAASNTFSYKVVQERSYKRINALTGSHRILISRENHIHRQFYKEERYVRVEIWKFILLFNSISKRKDVWKGDITCVQKEKTFKRYSNFLGNSHVVVTPNVVYSKLKKH